MAVPSRHRAGGQDLYRADGRASSRIASFRGSTSGFPLPWVSSMTAGPAPLKRHRHHPVASGQWQQGRQQGAELRTIGLVQTIAGSQLHQVRSA